jgi:BlaI family penicillinase repressor
MARKKKTDQLTPLELEIMKVLWDLGQASVQQVQQLLTAEPQLAYTTVQTMLNVLHRKGKVKRSLIDRAYFYRPAVSRDQVVTSTMKDIIDRLFGGSAESLVMSLVQTRHLTPEKLERLRRRLDQASAHQGEKE